MNLVQKAISHGGRLAPLAIPDTFGGMNPSILIDDDGEILVNVRVVNYILYHSEHKQQFPSRWGPLAYLHPENDLRLVTENYIVRLNSDLQMTDYTKVKMKNLHIPIWEFHGLEDARLVQWNGIYYLIGVRRDVPDHRTDIEGYRPDSGAGRMEYTTLALNKTKWTAKEVARRRIKAPGADDSYCEKNWAPMLDKPFTFIKWHSPVEVVYSQPDKPKTVQVALKQGVQPPKDQRGGSQLIRWGSQYISITHDVELYKNYLGQKDAIYRHRVCVYDDDLNLVGVSNEFSFFEGKVEFCVGAAKYGEDLLVSFSVSDNAAFVLQVPKLVVEDLIVEALNA
jgi:hypothetical protein